MYKTHSVGVIYYFSYKEIINPHQLTVLLSSFHVSQNTKKKLIHIYLHKRNTINTQSFSLSKSKHHIFYRKKIYIFLFTNTFNFYLLKKEDDWIFSFKHIIQTCRIKSKSIFKMYIFLLVCDVWVNNNQSHLILYCVI